MPVRVEVLKEGGGEGRRVTRVAILGKERPFVA